MSIQVYTSHRKTTRAVVAAIFLNQAIATLALATDNSSLLNIPGQQNDVTALMNKAAAFTSDQRLAVMNAPYQSLIKSKLQEMTCLDKIMSIKFSGLSAISFTAIVDGLIQSAIAALMKAACSLVDTAFDSAMGTLSQMTTVNMGAAGSVSLVNSNGTIAPAYNFGSNPFAAVIGDATINTPQNYSGFNPTSSAQSASAWEKTKNFFK